MAFWALIGATILYVVTACGFALRGDYPHAVAWAGYAVANGGFIWYVVRGT